VKPLGDLKIIWQLVAPVRGTSHAERLETFYANQADRYDNFRKRLLPGRRSLFEMLPVETDAVLVDMGGGTAANLEHLGVRLRRARRVYVVDLCPSLLAVARRRLERHNWTNVTLHRGDVLGFVPTEGMADIVTFSYSLTMIPEWFAALEQAFRILRPGGVLGVVDFYVSRKHAPPNRVRHSWATRTFWPPWFAHDNVFLSPDHLPYLCRRFQPEHVSEGQAKLPYLPGLRVPYYLFLGRKPADPVSAA